MDPKDHPPKRFQCHGPQHDVPTTPQKVGPGRHTALGAFPALSWCWASLQVTSGDWRPGTASGCPVTTRLRGGTQSSWAPGGRAPEASWVDSSAPKVFWTCLVVVTLESLAAVMLQVLRCNSNSASPPAVPSATQETQPKPGLPGPPCRCHAGYRLWEFTRCAGWRVCRQRNTRSHCICVTYDHRLPENHDCILQSVSRRSDIFQLCTHRLSCIHSTHNPYTPTFTHK